MSYFLPRTLVINNKLAYNSLTSLNKNLQPALAVNKTTVFLFIVKSKLSWKD